MKKHRCYRCDKIFTSKRKYSTGHGKKICDKCLIKNNGNKGKKPIHAYMKIKDILK